MKWVINVTHFTVTVTHFTVTVARCRCNAIRVMRAFSVDLPPRPHEVGYITATHFTVTVTCYRCMLKKGRLFGRIKWVTLPLHILQ